MEEDASDVCFDEYSWLPIGEGEDRVRCVGSDSWQAYEAGEIVGDTAVVVFRDVLCGALECECAAIVAESFPACEQVGEWCVCEIFDCRVGCEEFVVFAADAVGLCLLEHDLGEEDMVGVVSGPPRVGAWIVCVMCVDCFVYEFSYFVAASFLVVGVLDGFDELCVHRGLVLDGFFQCSCGGCLGKNTKSL